MEKILIVEDEKSMNEVLRILLEEEEYDVTSAFDGPEGLAHIKRDIFDIVITDIQMPGVDGFHLLKTVKEVAPETIVIMITAFGTTESAIDKARIKYNIDAIGQNQSAHG